MFWRMSQRKGIKLKKTTAGTFLQKVEKSKIPVINLMFLTFTGIIIALSIWGSELLAKYKDREILNQSHIEEVTLTGEGYRYALNSTEKLYIFSEALKSHLIRNQTVDQDYQQITGSYALVVNHRDPFEKQITSEGIYDSCNQELAHLKELGILPVTVSGIDKGTYTPVLYSAIDVLEPRNNVAVWKLSFSEIQKNTSRKNKLIDAYINADDGKIYEFYIRTEWEWEDIDPDAMIKAWSEYMGLQIPEKYEAPNPLMETTPYFKKYIYAGPDKDQVIVTIGFYEGINELFLKVSQ